MTTTSKVEFWRDLLAFLLSTPTTRFIHDGSNNDNRINNDNNNNNNNAIGINNDENLGFWGPIDSGIDWCEPNYTVTKYIAEFGNTLSAVPMVIWALFGCYLCWKSGVKEKRYMILLISLGTIGVGSITFHGTLRNSAQLLDEIPMMVASYCSLYCALEFSNKIPRKSTLYGIIIFVLFQAISYTILRMYFIFVIGFAIVMIIQIPIVGIKLYRFGAIIPNQAKYLLIFVTLLATMSFAMWTLENMYCVILGKFHFHAVWHFCGGYALYLYDLLLIYLRGLCLKKQSSFQFSQIVKQHYVEWINVKVL